MQLQYRIYRSLEHILCFGSITRFSCCLGDRAVWKIALATAMIFWGATAWVCCAIVCRRGRGWCPGRLVEAHDLSISRGRRQSSNSRRIASGALAQCEHAKSSWINSSKSFQSNSKAIQNMDFWTLVDLIEPNFPRSTTKMPSCFFIFWPIRSKFSSIQFKNLNWIHFFLR